MHDDDDDGDDDDDDGSGAVCAHLMASSFNFNYSPLFKMSFQPSTTGRIFPTNETWNNYGALLEYSSSNNLILHENLFPDVLMKPANRVQASDDDELMMTNTIQYCSINFSFDSCDTRNVQVRSRFKAGFNEVKTLNSVGL